MRKRYFRPMQKNEIWKIYGTDYRNMTKILLEETALDREIGDTGKRIGIKPNLVAPSPADWGATTHPEIVAGIIEYLQEHGFRNLLILESSWVGDKTTESMEVCGYNALCETYQVPFLDIQTDSHHTAEAAGMDLEICDGIDSVDFLINVPVLKGHCQTKITCALKNIKGLVPGSEKRHFHKMGLHKPIAHLNKAIRQDFIVIDHICGDLDFEDGGNPVVRNCIMAARDPVLTDAYVCSLLHYSVDDVPYVRLAEQLGVGSADLSQLKINVIGEDEDRELPRSQKVVAVMDAVQEVESCSACYGYLIPALDRFREEGLLEELLSVLPDKICIGQGYKGQTGKVGVGNCTRNFEFSVPGCPPVETRIYDDLRRYLEEHRKQTCDMTESEKEHRNPACNMTVSEEEHRKTACDMTASEEEPGKPSCDMTASEEEPGKKDCDQTVSEEESGKKDCGMTVSEEKHRKKTYDLAAFDMDGTLLDSRKTIRQDSLDAIRKAKEAGKVVTLSTGRCLPELRAYEEQLKDVEFYICMSGALVYSNREKKAIASDEIPPELVEQILTLTEDEDPMIHLLSWESIVERDKVDHIEQYHMAPYKSSYEACCIIPEDLRAWYREHPCPVFKLNLYCRDLEQRSRMEEKLARLPLEFAYSEETNLECSPCGVSKAEGLRRLCSHLGLQIENTIAVGDADNDLAILKAAGLSVAMGNAKDHIKAAADAVTLSCDEGGCAKVIHTYLLGD